MKTTGPQRMTQQLQTVMDTIAVLPCPVSASAIASHADMVPSTVYRCIKRLLQSGVIVPVATGNEVSYERAASDHHHHHIHCRSCDKVAEMPLCAVDTMISGDVLASAGFSTAETHVVEFFGICQDCAITT